MAVQKHPFSKRKTMAKVAGSQAATSIPWLVVTRHTGASQVCLDRQGVGTDRSNGRVHRRGVDAQGERPEPDVFGVVGVDAGDAG